MKIPRSALNRYRIIDKLLRNTMRTFPTLVDFQNACQESLGSSPSDSTIEKDIKNMRLSYPIGYDAPIVFCRTNRGYYYEDTNFSINLIRLTGNDIDTIKEALELIHSIGGNRVSERFDNAIGKILVAYKEEFSANNVKRKIIQTDSVEEAKGYDNFNPLFKACKNQNPVSFSHYSYQKREFKSVIVHPVLLKEFDNRWYLVGYSESHKEIRTFGFDRIYKPLLLKRKYIPSNEEAITMFCNNVYGVFPVKNEKKQDVVFTTTPIITNYIEAYPLHFSQKVEKLNEGYGIFSLNLVPSIELVRLFRSYGSDLAILEPDWLDKMIKEEH